VTRHPRCIALDGGWRCPRKAAKRSGDIYVCGQHSRMWLMLLIEDWCALPTRRMLAYSKWETYAEGKRLIERLHGKRAA
jgi:hypothetical protein